MSSGQGKVKVRFNKTQIKDGKIAVLRKDGRVKFYKYELVKGTSQLVENVNANVQNGTIFYAPELTIVLNKLQANTRNEILLLAQTITKH